MIKAGQIWKQHMDSEAEVHIHHVTDDGHLLVFYVRPGITLGEYEVWDTYTLLKYYVEVQ